MSRDHVAYLVSKYPNVSHTFISREVHGVRARGMRVETFSIRRPAPADVLTDEDRADEDETFYVLPPSPAALLRAHATALRSAPWRYVRTLARALRLSAGGARNGLWQAFYFAEAILLWHELRRRGVRHVHAHFANVATGVAILVAEFGGPEWSWSFTMHGSSEFDDVTHYALADKVRSAEFVACIGDYCRSQLMKLVEPEYWGKLAIVRCGIDTDVFAAVDRSQRPDGPLRVLCVGRLVPGKGQAILIEAVATLRARGHDVRLTLVGEGPHRPALEAHARKLGVQTAVTFAGAVGQDRIRDHYAAADVFCLPSFSEGIPVVLMEAMATRLPVVTTHIMGIPELVIDDVTGLLVMPGRADALADALARLQDDRALRRRLGDAGRGHVRAEFELMQSATAMRSLLAHP